MGRSRGEGASDRCPVTFALDVFGDQWSLLILRDLLFKRKKHYGEFLDSSEGISTNILASRLAKLEAAGLITKERDPEHRSKFVYGLTEKGGDLLPVLLAMIEWSAKYDPQPGVPDNIIEGAPRRLLRRWRSEPRALVREILDAVDPPT